LHDKSETQYALKKLLKRAQNEFNAKFKKIRSYYGTEFKNTQVKNYLDKKASSISFRPPTLLHKMGWPTGRIGLSLSQEEPCLMNRKRLTVFG
jgi:hypothetical protein